MPFDQFSRLAPDRPTDKHRAKANTALAQCRVVACIKTTHPKVIWEGPHRHPRPSLLRLRITTPQNHHWLQWNAIHLPSKLMPLPFDDLQTASGAVSHFTTVHPLDRQTDRQTDTWDWQQVCTNLPRAAYAQQRSIVDGPVYISERLSQLVLYQTSCTDRAGHDAVLRSGTLSQTRAVAAPALGIHQVPARA